MMIDGDWEKALDFLDSIIIVAPRCTKTYNIYRFRIHSCQKEFDQAEENLNLYFENGNKPGLEDSIILASMYKELGREKEALIILNSSRISYEKRLAKNADFFTYYYLSVIHSILGEKEEALKYLSESAELGFIWGYHDFVEIHPPFEKLWDDPKFKAIVKRAQDEKAAIRAQVREMEERGEIDL